MLHHPRIIQVYIVASGKLSHAFAHRSRRQRMKIGKYSFVNRTIQHWNQLPAEVLRILPCKPITFKKEGKKSDY